MKFINIISREKSSLRDITFVPRQMIKSMKNFINCYYRGMHILDGSIKQAGYDTQVTESNTLQNLTILRD